MSSLVLAGAGWVGTAPAYAANTVNVTMDCSGDVGLYADAGDTVIITMTSGCNYSHPNYEWNLWNVNGPNNSNTAEGYLQYVSRVEGPTSDPNLGFVQYAPNANYATDWYVAAPDSGTAVITTTLLATDGAFTALSPGVTLVNVNNEYWWGDPSTVFNYAITWLGPYTSGGGSTSSAPTAVIDTLTIGTPDSGVTCASGNLTGTRGTWLWLPTADDCHPIGDTPAGSVLLGWSTSAAFPVARAQNQINRGWGVIDEQINGVGMIFIPAGMATFLSGSNTLYPIWSPPAT